MVRIHRYQFCAILVFFLSLSASNSASTFLSEGIFGHHIAQGRNLLQAKTEQVNDLSNDCATTMFSYINLNGKYPPGLFASECREGKEGLECPALAPSLSANASGSQMTGKPAKALILGTTFIVLLLQVF